MSLDTKYRSASWDQVLGNKAALESLQAHIKNPERPHLYMFYGQSGIGKTTIARILANSLNVGTVDERNLSKDNGVGFARDFQQEVMYKGFGGTKFIILDECHRLTNDAQDILLKIFEEPPEHLYLALCTTEPEKLKDTIYKRAARYELKNPKRDEMFNHLKFISETEGIVTTDQMLNQILNQTENNPRESIKMLETLTGVSVDNQPDLIRGFGTERREAIELCRALLNGSDWISIANIIGRMDAEPESVRRMVVNYMTKVLLSSNNMTAYAALTIFDNLPIGCGRPGIVRGSYQVLLEMNNRR